MDKLLGHFDRAYLINLPERIDRLRHARSELKQAGWWDRTEVFAACRPEDRGPFLSRGVRGCFQSHLECLKASQGNPLVLEDDIVLARSLPLLESLLASHLQSPWDIVYFGHERTGEIPCATPRARRIGLEEAPKRVQTTYFYGVHERIVPRLIAFLEALLSRPGGHPEGGPMAIDGALNTFRAQNRDVRTLMAVPKLGFQRPSRSDITPSRWDSMIALRPFLTAGRHIKSLIRTAS